LEALRPTQILGIDLSQVKQGVIEPRDAIRKVLQELPSEKLETLKKVYADRDPLLSKVFTLALDHKEIQYRIDKEIYARLIAFYEEEENLPKLVPLLRSLSMFDSSIKIEAYLNRYIDLRKIDFTVALAKALYSDPDRRVNERHLVEIASVLALKDHEEAALDLIPENKLLTLQRWLKTFASEIRQEKANNLPYKDSSEFIAKTENIIRGLEKLLPLAI
jgi:hypothetical protein